MLSFQKNVLRSKWRSMKILYFLRDITDCGGIQRTTGLIINSMLKRKEDYQICTVSLYHKYVKPFFYLDSSIENYSLFDKVVDTRKQFIKIKRRCAEVMESKDPDIIVVQGTAFSNYIPNYVWKKCKVIVCEHGHFYMGEKYGLHWFGKRKALKRARSIVTLTSLDADNYKKYNARQIPVINIYNPCIDQQSLEINYDSTSKIIVSCGTLDTIKRFDHVIETAKQVFKKYPDWEWYIFGDGKQRDSLQRMIEDYNLQNKIILKGYEQSKSVIYGNKAFLVLTSKFEGFGMVLIEAMQFRLPVISYDINYGPREIVKNGENGYLVSNGDTNELAQTVEEFISDVEMRKRLSDGACKSLENFSIEKITNQWIDLFESI